MASKKDQLKQLLQKVVGTDDKTLEAFQTFNGAVSKLQSDLKEKMQVATLDKVNTNLKEFQNKLDYTPLLNALEQIKNEIVSRDTELTISIEERIESLRGELSDTRGKSKDSIVGLEEEVRNLEGKLTDLSNRKPPEFPNFLLPIQTSETKIMKVIDSIKPFDDADLKKEIETLDEAIKKLRIELLSRLNDRGGGMNRQILIASVDPLTKFTDINLKAGSNVTITYADNSTTKKVDVTIAATGGGGSTRVITSIAINTNAGSTSGVDYVYLCSGTLTLTMPTTVGNTNLYTVKNIGTGVITIATTGGETIDGSSNLIMPTQFTSVDLISNNSGDWAIT